MLMATRLPRDQPWLDEPDLVAWREPSTGYQCLILRGPLGSLCGYVRVPRGHALHGKGYNQRRVRNVDVHGGLTFSGCLGGRKMKRGHWFGFDCAHAFDVVPGMPSLQFMFEEAFAAFNSGNVYRTVAYVRAECTTLAWQLEAKASR